MFRSIAIKRKEVQRQEQLSDSDRLILAVDEGNLPRAQELLDHGPVNVSESNSSTSWTALETACSAGRLEMAKLLIDYGAKVNLRNMIGMTPLHMTCDWNGNLELSEMLIKNGADVNIKDTTAGRTPLHRACDYGHLKIIKLLVQNGANTNAKNKFGKTPLHKACERRDAFEVVKFLNENGADVNVKDNDGKTPLHVACENHRLDVVWLLVRHQHPFLMVAE